MEQKPVIQYVGQFYVYGSEVKAPKKKKEEKKYVLPSPPKPAKEHFVYIDPVAVCGIVLAVVLLVSLVLGAIQLKSAMDDYNAETAVLSSIQRQNAVLEHRYRTSLDLEAVQTQAEKLGLVAQAEAEHRSVYVNAPEPSEEETLVQRLWWHIRGLLYGVDESKADVFEKDDLTQIANGTYQE